MIKPNQSVTDKLKTVKFQSNTENAKTNSENNSEEYPKLRKLKPATLLKIQERQKKIEQKIMTQIKAEKVQIPLCQEFLNIKEQLEIASSKLLDNINFKYKSEATLDKNKVLDIHLKDLDRSERSQKFVEANVNPLKYCELQLINTLYNKIQFHKNGFFAEKIPLWYKDTFDKYISEDWFDLVKISNKFDIEEVQNKVVIYPKENLKDNELGIDLNAAGFEALKGRIVTTEDTVGGFTML